MPERWQVDVAAMLSQLGCITLPPDTLEKVYYGQTLAPDEDEMVSRMPSIAEQLLGNVPRLEIVRGILASYTKPYRRFEPDAKDPDKALVHRGAQLLQVASAFDVLTAQGHAPSHALDVMRGRHGHYDPVVLDALTAVQGGDARADEIRELALSALQAGMVFAEDVKMETGMLLVARGYEVTAGFVARARNFRPGTIKEPLRVIVRLRTVPDEITNHDKG